MRDIHILLLLVLPSAWAGWDDCEFDVDDKKYYLKSMRGLSINGSDTQVSTYTYEVSLCGNASNPCTDIMTGNTDYGAVYQFGGEPGGKEVCWDILSYWEDGGGIQPQTSSLDPTLGDDGFSLTIANGDSCKSSPRQTTINVICDTSLDPTKSQGKVEGAQDSQDSCHFIINYHTKCGCAGECNGAGPSPSGGGGGGGLGAGWIIIIVIFVVAFCYFVAGYAFFGYRAKDWSTESLPNKAFWCALPGWTLTGCKISAGVTGAFCKRLYGKISGKGGDDDDYDPDDTTGEDGEA